MTLRSAARHALELTAAAALGFVAALAVLSRPHPRRRPRFDPWLHHD